MWLGLNNRYLASVYTRFFFVFWSGKHLKNMFCSLVDWQGRQKKLFTEGRRSRKSVSGFGRKHAKPKSPSRPGGADRRTLGGNDFHDWFYTLINIYAYALYQNIILAEVYSGTT